MNFDDHHTNGTFASSLHVCLDQCIVSTSPFHDECSNDVKSFVFRRTIYIPTEMETTSYRSKVMVSVAVIFNLALAHHVFAMETDNPEIAEQLLRKAAKLYELGYNLQRAPAMNSNSSSVFAMAAINNLGQIYERLGERDRARRLFTHLLSTLMMLIDCRQVNVSQFECFFRSTSHLIFQYGDSAAAAA